MGMKFLNMFGNVRLAFNDKTYLLCLRMVRVHITQHQHAIQEKADLVRLKSLCSAAGCDEFSGRKIVAKVPSIHVGPDWKQPPHGMDYGACLIDTPFGILLR